MKGKRDDSEFVVGVHDGRHRVALPPWHSKVSSNYNSLEIGALRNNSGSKNSIVVENFGIGCNIIILDDDSMNSKSQNYVENTCKSNRNPVELRKFISLDDLETHKNRKSTPQNVATADQSIIRHEQNRRNNYSNTNTGLKKSKSCEEIGKVDSLVRKTKKNESFLTVNKPQKSTVVESETFFPQQEGDNRFKTNTTARLNSSMKSISTASTISCTSRCSSNSIFTSGSFNNTMQISKLLTSTNDPSSQRSNNHKQQDFNMPRSQILRDTNSITQRLETLGIESDMKSNPVMDSISLFDNSDNQIASLLSLNVTCPNEKVKECWNSSDSTIDKIKKTKVSKIKNKNTRDAAIFHDELDFTFEEPDWHNSSLSVTSPTIDLNSSKRNDVPNEKDSQPCSFPKSTWSDTSPKAKTLEDEKILKNGNDAQVRQCELQNSTSKVSCDISSSIATTTSKHCSHTTEDHTKNRKQKMRDCIFCSPTQQRTHLSLSNTICQCQCQSQKNATKQTNNIEDSHSSMLSKKISTTSDASKTTNCIQNLAEFMDSSTKSQLTGATTVDLKNISAIVVDDPSCSDGSISFADIFKTNGCHIENDSGQEEQFESIFGKEIKSIALSNTSKPDLLMSSSILKSKSMKSCNFNSSLIMAPSRVTVRPSVGLIHQKLSESMPSIKFEQKGKVESIQFPTQSKSSLLPIQDHGETRKLSSSFVKFAKERRKQDNHQSLNKSTDLEASTSLNGSCNSKQFVLSKSELDVLYNEWIQEMGHQFKGHNPVKGEQPYEKPNVSQLSSNNRVNKVLATPDRKQKFRQNGIEATGQPIKKTHDVSISLTSSKITPVDKVCKDPIPKGPVTMTTIPSDMTDMTKPRSNQHIRRDACRRAISKSPVRRKHDAETADNLRDHSCRNNSSAPRRRRTSQADEINEDRMKKLVAKSTISHQCYNADPSITLVLETTIAVVNEASSPFRVKRSFSAEPRPVPTTTSRQISRSPVRRSRTSCTKELEELRQHRSHTPQQQVSKQVKEIRSENPSGTVKRRGGKRDGIKRSKILQDPVPLDCNEDKSVQTSTMGSQGSCNLRDKTLDKLEPSISSRRASPLRVTKRSEIGRSSSGIRDDRNDSKMKLENRRHCASKVDTAKENKHTGSNSYANCSSQKQVSSSTEHITFVPTEKSSSKSSDKRSRSRGKRPETTSNDRPRNERSRSRSIRTDDRNMKE